MSEQSRRVSEELEASMRRALGEEEDRARLHRRLFHQAHRVLDGAHAARRRVVGLVAAGNEGKAPVARVHVRELPGDRDPGAVHPPVLVMVGDDVCPGLAGTVQEMPLRSRLGADQQRSVVEPEPLAAHLV